MYLLQVLIGSLDCLFPLLYELEYNDFGFGFTTLLYNSCTCLLDATRDSEEGKQAYENDNCSLSVTILASLVAVLTVALLIFGVCFLSWRKKQRKGNLLSYLYNMSAGCY